MYNRWKKVSEATINRKCVDIMEVLVDRTDRSTLLWEDFFLKEKPVKDQKELYYTTSRLYFISNIGILFIFTCCLQRCSQFFEHKNDNSKHIMDESINPHNFNIDNKNSIFINTPPPKRLKNTPYANRMHFVMSCEIKYFPSQFEKSPMKRLYNDINFHTFTAKIFRTNR